MNKKAFVTAAAIASTAFSTGTFAQSSVTLFGVIDMAISRTQADGLGNKVGLSSGNQAASRLGFRGTEDLGGGLSAGFWLEGNLTADDGTSGGLAFMRRSTVSLAGPFGEVRLGRDFSPTYLNVFQFEPFGGRGVGQSLATGNFGYSDVRNNNMVQYFLPSTLGGFYGNVVYSFSGSGVNEPQSNQPNNKLGRSWGGRVGYANGPLNVAVAYTTWDQVIGASNTAPIVIGRDLDVTNVGASYDFGMAKLMGYYGREKVSGNPANNNSIDSFLLGVTAPLGNGELRASISRYDLKNSASDTNKLAIGYGYNLSKRTQLYATLATQRNKGAAVRQVRPSDGLALTGNMTPGGKSTGFDLGVRHSF